MKFYCITHSCDNLMLFKQQSRDQPLIKIPDIRKERRENVFFFDCSQ